jgi:predicted nucleotidyltransferase
MTHRHQEVLDNALRIIQSELDPPRIYLFGSRASGQNQPHSDFDLAIDSPRPEFRQERQLRDAVNEAAGLYKIDIVYLPHIEPDFRDIILGTGKLVYEKAA